MSMVLLCNVLFIMPEEITELKIETDSQEYETVDYEVMWKDYFTKEEYMILDERGEKFVQKLNELWDKGRNINDYAIAYSPNGVIKSAVLYRYTKVYDKKEWGIEFTEWPEQSQ